MKTILARSPHESSFSFSRRYFQRRKVSEGDGDDEDEEEGKEEEFLTFIRGCASDENKELTISNPIPVDLWQGKKRRAFSRLKSSALSLFHPKPRTNPNSLSSPLGSKVIGTLFGHRRGHVRFALQDSPKSIPAFLIELSTPTSILVREMASGLVRVALECDKKLEKKGSRLLEEPLWRTYCNGRKCGYAMRRECGAEEWRVLRAVEPITMGAGVLPSTAEDRHLKTGGGGGGGGGGAGLGNEADGSEEEGGGCGELMYMRAKYERVVGSKDSEAFYMMNPDGSGCPELSLYLLRV